MLQNLNVVAEGVEENACECPFCGGNSSLQFNDAKGLWLCFKCGEKGTAKTLVEMLHGTYREPEVELAQISDELRSLGTDPHQSPRVLHDGYLLRYRSGNGPHRLWLDRGFDKAACDRWELGWDALAEALTLPYRDPSSGHLAGIIFRRTSDESGPRYKFPAGFARSSSLYGSWLLGSGGVGSGHDPDVPVLLAEGPTDAVRISQTGARAVSQYGSSISAGQIRLLHRLGVRRIVLFYDYDRAGLRATEKGQHLAEEFLVERMVWDREKYCWHSWVCGCGTRSKDTWIEHTSNTKACLKSRECRCGRIHEPDPCSLGLKEIKEMTERTVAV